MHTKTMEGLIGARTNTDMMNVPMRVYKEARRKGDRGTMERAMGYACDFQDKAEEYKEKAKDGMKKDAEAAAEKEKAQSEEMVEKRREENRKMKKELAENREDKSVKGAESGADTVGLSEEGKILSKQLGQADYMQGQEGVKTEVKAGMEPVIYTKTGETSGWEQTETISVSV